MKKRRQRTQSRSGFSVKPPALELHPRTKNWVLGIGIGVASFLILLSLFNAAGPVGRVLQGALLFLFGWGAWFVPFLGLAIAYLAFQTERRIAASSILGGGLILLAFLALLDISSKHGGVFGHAVAFPLVKGFGATASFIVFLALGAVGGFTLFNYPADRRKNRRMATTNAADTATISFGKEKGEKNTEGLLDRMSNFRIRPLEKQVDPASLRPEERAGHFSTSEKERSDFPIRDDVAIRAYEQPPIDLLEREHGSPKAGDIRANMGIIKRTFANFGIAVEMGEVTVGPTVTQYTLKPAEGVKLARIRGLENDLALALAAHPIRLEAPIPGRSLVGIEVPNQAVTLVRLRNLLEHQGYRDSAYRLTVAVGRDVAGEPIFASLEKMPHLLIAGATGTGKTIALNSVILSLLYRNPPSLLRLLLVDPKRVEFPVYNDIPHLITPVIVDGDKIIHALRWAVSEMERRFNVLSQSKTRDIGLYNRSLKKGEEPMPYLVVVIDELADIMAARGREAEAAIVRLAQMARAVGIHLVVATQRPSVEVITGLIKANITSRIAFQVASQIDSRTIIDGSGAEKLLGNGDMLFISAEASRPRRLQGAYISEKEVKRVAEFLKERGSSVDYEEGVTEPQEGEAGEWMGGEGGAGDDPLYEEAKRLVIQMRKASASYLQRRLRVGYARAARLLDILEERGVVGPGDGAKPREVLLGTGGRADDEWKEE